MTHDIAMTERRGFLRSMIAGLGAVIGGAYAWPALRYLFSQPAESSKTEWSVAGAVAQLPADRPVQIAFERASGDAWETAAVKASAWVVKTPRGPVAFAPACTHLGCAYHWDAPEKVFLCPCHGSAFTIDGAVKTGPAARPLDRYEVRVENGNLMIGPLERRS